VTAVADPNGTNTAQNSAIEGVLGLKGQTLTAGQFVDVEIPWNSFIFRWTLLGDQVGSAQVDIQVCTEAQFDGGASHPTSGDSIVGGNFPTISGATKGQDTALVGWIRTQLAGNVLRMILTSVSNIQQLTVSLEVFR
jgi:hypothetical protein